MAHKLVVPAFVDSCLFYFSILAPLNPLLLLLMCMLHLAELISEGSIQTRDTGAALMLSFVRR